MKKRFFIDDRDGIKNDLNEWDVPDFLRKKAESVCNHLNSIVKESK